MTTIPREDPVEASRPRLAYDGQRQRIPLHPIVEAAARVALAWARNRYGFRSRRALLPFALKTAQFFAMRGIRQTVEADMPDGLHVVVSTGDGTIGRSVYTSGDWDPLLVGAVFDALRAYRVAYRGGTFLEVGANFGVYSLPAVASYGFGRAIAYEPDPGSFELLVANIERNGLEGRITAHNAALSAAPGELILRLGTYNAGDNRIVDDAATAVGISEPTGGLVQVPARTFDDEVAAGRIQVDQLTLAWIDVQGHELSVLKGARKLLDAQVPLVIEFATSMLTSASRLELEDLLVDSYAAMVDLGWCALADRLIFQPADAIRRLSGGGTRNVETDLLLLP